MSALDGSAGRRSEAERVLRESGIPGVVAVRGDGSIAALTVPPEYRAEMTGPTGRAIAERIRALGFRYVAMDLAGIEHPHGNETE